ncbi:MAG: PRC-barrel domain-containing protein [Xanthobacteraceae bacterium]
MRAKLLTAGLVIALIGTAESRLVLAQAMVPPTGMEDAKKPMTPEQRMQARFPQNVRVGDLIGLPVLDESSSTLGHVSEVVRTQGDKIELIVAYGGFLGWYTRPVAVPIEVVGIQGREVASIDMSPSDYAKAPTWRGINAEALPGNAIIKIALSRR